WSRSRSAARGRGSTWRSKPTTTPPAPTKARLSKNGSTRLAAKGPRRPRCRPRSPSCGRKSPACEAKAPPLRTPKKRQKSKRSRRKKKRKKRKKRKLRNRPCAETHIKHARRPPPPLHSPQSTSRPTERELAATGSERRATDARGLLRQRAQEGRDQGSQTGDHEKRSPGDPRGLPRLRNQD